MLCCATLSQEDFATCLAHCRVHMVTIRDSLISVGAEPSNLVLILQALADDSIGHSGEKDASDSFTSTYPAVLGQRPHWLNVRRCNIVKKVIREAKGGDAHHVCCLPSLLLVVLAVCRQCKYVLTYIPECSIWCTAILQSILTALSVVCCFIYA